MDGHRIAPGLRGWLEHPPANAVAQDCLMVSGWAFSSGAPIVNVWAQVARARRPLHYGLRREDVQQAYEHEPAALHSGFSGYIEFDRPDDGRVRLEVSATLGDGRSVTLFERRLLTVASGKTLSPVQVAVSQAIDQPRLLFSPRSWLDGLALLRRSWWPTPRVVSRTTSAETAHTQAARRALARFLGRDARLTFPTQAAPVVSVILVIWNRADLTLQCLKALAPQHDVAFEVVIVDNASTDETTAMLSRVDGVNVIRHASNIGFTLAANIGAQTARGEFLFFLNNDAEITPGSLARLVETARRRPDAGAVGGKLVFPDGRLQEAGAIIWADGSCEAYGRGGDPTSPEFNFERDVDFCSAALLLTPRALFEQFGGFDERYQPAYYEDADYCVRLWTRGRAVVYQPSAVAVHHEFGSAVSTDASIELQRARRPLFVSKHGQWLASQSARDAGTIAARSHPHGLPSVVIIDDAVPEPGLGAGFPRAAALVRALVALGHHVTLYTTASGAAASAARRAFPTIEIVAGGPAGLHAFLDARRGDRCVIVSRPHNMQYLKAAVGSDLSALGVPCVYDAEAVFALRVIGRRQLIGQPLAEAEARAQIDDECRLARGCAAVLVVSEAERALFESSGVTHAFRIAHAVRIAPTPRPWRDRTSILFVGAFTAESPNEDAVRFFCGDVLPAVRAEGCDAPFVVAGARIPESLRSSADPVVTWRQGVEDLTPLYDDARVFVAPTRYAAGIPLKIVEAAARGVPVVCSMLVAGQLGWRSDEELIAADDPPAIARAIAGLFSDAGRWQRQREAALKRVAREYSVEAFRDEVARALHGAAPRP
ncbi:MAG: glycosyltransferase [Acidobacteria bacterium]|nr:glycosyltransferase [Acidobacteriota bacterium]